MQTNRELIEAAYRAFAKRDIPTIISLISPEVVITQSTALPWGGQYSGYDGLQKFFGALLGHIDSNVEIERILDAGENAVVIGRTKGTVRANGNEFDIPIAHLWRIQNGKLIAFQPFVENSMMLDALKG